MLETDENDELTGMCSSSKQHCIGEWGKGHSQWKVVVYMLERPLSIQFSSDPTGFVCDCRYNR